MMIYLQVAESELLFIVTRNYFGIEETFSENTHKSSIDDFRFIHNTTNFVCISILEKFYLVLTNPFKRVVKTVIFLQLTVLQIFLIFTPPSKMNDHALIIICRSHRMLHE